MTKVGTMDTRKFMSLIMAAAMVLATVTALIVPRVAQAATSDGVTGSFTVNDGSFSVGSVTVYTTTDNSSTTNPSPHADYHIKVDVTNTSGLDKLTEVEAILYYDADGTYSDNNEVGSDAAASHATFTWTPAGGFVLTGPGSTTWVCSDAGSVEPTDLSSKTQDVWEFHVTIGDVATYAPASGTPRWFAYGSATDAGGTEENVSSALTMQWYGSIDAGATITWSGAAPGTNYTEQTVSVTYICNGAFNKQASASSPWGTDAILTDSDTLGANQFALKADDTNGTEPGADHRLISTGYRTIATGTQTTEAGDPDTSGVWLKLGSPFTQGTYGGTVYFQISN